MHQVLDLMDEKKRQIAVLSAISGTTNALQKMADQLYVKDLKGFGISIDSLKSHYQVYVSGLYSNQSILEAADQFLEDTFLELQDYANRFFTIKEERELLSFGEILSTNLFFLLAQEKQKPMRLLNALDFMRTDQNSEPDLTHIRNSLNQLLNQKDECLFVTQGYICLDHNGDVSNLKRGGSDYTAALIGEAVLAHEVQIWTDIDGMHNNDPRVVEDTLPIEALSYNEAAELAYFGAKVLHPQCVFPVQRAQIPLSIRYTMDPNANGTTICRSTKTNGIKSVAAKDGITAVKIKSARMLMAYGFLRRVFEIFENHRTPIDMITTSEVAVSLTIDDTKYLNQIVTELRELGDVEIEMNQTIICIVGDLISDSKGYASRIFSALEDIPIRMVSYGGSKHNVSILIQEQHKTKTLSRLHETLFETV